MDSLKGNSRDGETVDRGELISLFQLTTRLMARSFHGGGGHVHHAQRKILSILKESGPLPQVALLEILDIRSASLSELIGKLERAGLVKREKNEADRRGMVISLTPLALVEMQKAHQGASQAGELLQCLSEAECGQLRLILNKLAASLRECGEDDVKRHCGFGRHHGGRGFCGR